MKATIESGRYLRLEDAKVIFRNFGGDKDKFHPGRRSFSVPISDPDTAQWIADNGWTVKTKILEDGNVFQRMEVRIGDKGDPYICLKTGDRTVVLDRETVGMLDEIDIDHVNLIIAPSDWEFNGQTGRTAYLEEIVVYRRRRFFAEEESAGDVPFDV